jgi:hypothetical protein
MARTDRLFLAGDGEAWVVDPSSETARHLSMQELPPGDAPYRVVRRADALVAWAYRTLVVYPGDEPTFDVLVRDSLFFISSSAPDRVWVGIVDESQDDGRLTAVREVAIDGRVTVPDTRPPDGAWPVAAVDGIWCSAGGETRVGPSTGRDVDRLPGRLPVAWRGQLWPVRRRVPIHVKDVSSGEALVVELRSVPRGSRPSRGVLTRRSHPGGRRPETEDAARQLALIDVAPVGPVVDEAAFLFLRLHRLGAVGDTVFITGGQLAGRRQIVEYRVGDAGAHVLDVSVGDFYGMATFRDATEVATG